MIRRAQPRHLAAGTVIGCTAVYDNTAANPNNPNPSATVRDGQQSTDEMFQGMLELAQPTEKPASNTPALWLLGAALAVTLVWMRAHKTGRQVGQEPEGPSAVGEAGTNDGACMMTDSLAQPIVLPGMLHIPICRAGPAHRQYRDRELMNERQTILLMYDQERRQNLQARLNRVLR
jgi:hypothetical protein